MSYKLISIIASITVLIFFLLKQIFFSIVSSYHQYEDRGMVDDKGEVQITRKHAQSKKTGSCSSDDIKHFRKQIRPICPPSNNNNNSNNNQAKLNRGGNSTRYSTMLSMSAMLDDCPLQADSAGSKVLTDINDNLQPFDEYAKKTEDTDAGNFRNFDIWNSNVVSPLSPTNSNSLEHYKSLDKALIGFPCDWGKNTKHWPPKTSSFGGCRYQNKSTISEYSRPYGNYFFNKIDEQDRPIAIDTMQYHAVCHRDQPSVPYYMLLHPPIYQYSNHDAISYSQSSVFNHVRDDQTRTPSYGNCDHWTRRNGRVDVHDSIAMDGQNFAVEKRDDCGFRYEGSAAKVENDTALSSTSNFFPPGYGQNCASNFVLNFTPIYTLSGTSKNHTSRFSTASSDNDKRLRPILKQATDRQL